MQSFCFINETRINSKQQYIRISQFRKDDLHLQAEPSCVGTTYSKEVFKRFTFLVVSWGIVRVCSVVTC